MMNSNELSPKEGDAALCEAFQVVRLAHRDIAQLFREIDGAFDKARFRCTGNPRHLGSNKLYLEEPNNFCSTELSRIYISMDGTQIVEININTIGKSVIEKFSIPYVQCALWVYKGRMKDSDSADVGTTEEGYQATPRTSLVAGQKYVAYSYARTDKTSTSTDLIGYYAYVLRLLSLTPGQIDEMIVSPLVELASSPEAFDLGKKLAGKPFDGALIDCSDDELWAWFDQE